MEYETSNPHAVVQTKCANILRSVGKTVGMLSLLGVAPAVSHAEIGVGLGIGSVSVGVGIGHSSGGVGVGAGVGVGDAGTGGLVAGVGTTVGTQGVGVGVGVGTNVASAGPTTPGTRPASGPVDPSAVNTDPGAIAKARRMLASMACATGGNTTAFNGFAVIDSSGGMIGWVHDASISTRQSIQEVKMQAVNNTCVGLKGGSFAVRGNALVVNMDGSRFR